MVLPVLIPSITFLYFSIMTTTYILGSSSDSNFGYVSHTLVSYSLFFSSTHKFASNSSFKMLSSQIITDANCTYQSCATGILSIGDYVLDFHLVYCLPDPRILLNTENFYSVLPAFLKYVLHDLLGNMLHSPWAEKLRNHERSTALCLNNGDMRDWSSLKKIPCSQCFLIT